MRVPVFLSLFLILYVPIFGQLDISPCGEVFYDSFEYKLENWSQVGNECNRTKDYASSGVYGMQLRDNSDLRSSITSKAMDLSNYSQLSFSFNYLCKNFEDNENFVLEFSLDGGASFCAYETWVMGEDFKNDEQKSESFKLDLPFTDETIFRITCDASHNDDQVFIDEIQITNCPPEGKALSNVKHAGDIITVSKKNDEGSLVLHANPTDEIFTINMGLLEGQSGSIEIYNKTGAKLSRSFFKYDHDGQMSFPFDYLENGDYSVCVKSSDNKLFVLRLVVGS